MSPFREVRQRYEDLSSTELIEALHGMRQISTGYLKAKEDFEASLMASGDGGVERFDEVFEAARQDFGETIDRWQQRNGDRISLVEALDEKRRNYEQRVLDLEFEKALAALAHGEHAALVTDYETAHRAYEEAEVHCEEIRHPYEQAIQ